MKNLQTWNDTTSSVRALFFALMLSIVAFLPQPAMAASSDAAYPTLSAQGILDLVPANKGKVLIINFFASWCPPCREEIPNILSARKQYAPEELTIIGVSLDKNEGDLKKFATGVGFNYPIYQAGPDVSDSFNISGIPHNTVYDRSGRLYINQTGYVSKTELQRMIKKLLAPSAS